MSSSQYKSGSIYLILIIAIGLLVGAGVFWYLCIYQNTPEKAAVHGGNGDTLLIGTDAEFPPFTFMENGKLVGFDIDFLKEIGERLHKKVEIKIMPFTALLPSLQLGNIQVAASGLTETPERAQHMLFVSPYIVENPLVIVSLPNAPLKTVQELAGKEVIVNDGYTADLYISKISGPIIKRLKSPAEAFLALKSGHAAAFITAQNTVAPVLVQYGAHAFYTSVIPNTEDTASLAVAPQHKELRDQIQQAQDSMKQDGTLEKLKKKWGL